MLANLASRKWPWVALLLLIGLQIWVSTRTLDPEKGLIVRTSPSGAGIYRKEPELFLTVDATSAGGNKETLIGTSPGPLFLSKDELPLTLVFRKDGFEPVERHLKEGAFGGGREYPQVVPLPVKSVAVSIGLQLLHHGFGVSAILLAGLLGLGLRHRSGLEAEAQKEKENVQRGLLKPGMKVGDYTVVKRIGAGGMGQIFSVTKAGETESLALKLLDTGDDETRAAFLDEVRATAQVEDPGLLLLYDWGEYAERFYMVTELLKGETLKERLEAGKLSSEKVAEIGVQVSRTLKAVHSKRMVHRDVKPSNIFLTTDGKVKLMDFGVASAMGEQGRQSGTVGYAPPEQLSGSRADARSDIYALGVTLAECLLGRTLFEGRTQLEVEQAQQNPDQISWSGEISEEWISLLKRSVDADPDQRPSSVQEFEDLFS
jgi:hypothetical protein